MGLPDIRTGLDRLLGLNENVKYAVETYEPANKFAQQIADQTPAVTAMDTVARIQEEVSMRYGDKSKVGHLLSHYMLNRDKQMATLSGLGKDVLLSVLSQGVLPAQLAKALEVSYETFNEYMYLTTSPEELKKAEALGADAMVADALDGLTSAVDKEDLQQAKAIAEYTFKVAKTMNTRYSDKPSTAVQVNNYGENAETSVSTATPFLQVVLPPKEELPELKPHKHQAESRQDGFKAQGFIEGEFVLFNGDSDGGS